MRKRANNNIKCFRSIKSALYNNPREKEKKDTESKNDKKPNSEGYLLTSEQKEKQPTNPKEVMLTSSHSLD